MPGTTVQGVPLLGDGTSRKAYQEGLMYALYHDGIRKREQALPSVPWRPSGQTGNIIVQCT